MKRSGARVELNIGDKIVRTDGGQPGGPSGRIGLFLERRGVVFLASTTPVLGNSRPISLLGADGELTPVGRSSELRRTRREEYNEHLDRAMSASDLISVVPLSNVEALKSIRDNRLAVASAAEADETVACPVALLRGQAVGANGKVRDARAFARLKLSPNDDPAMCCDIIEVVATDNRAFGQSGDSGALVKLRSDEMLGLLIGAAPGGVGLVAPLHDLLKRERFSIFPYARVRVDVNGAAFSNDVDKLLDAIRDRPEQFDDLIAAHAATLGSYFETLAATATPGAVTQERSRFIEAALAHLDEEALRIFVARLEQGPLLIETAGLDWFIELLFADGFLEIEDASSSTLVGVIRGQKFHIPNWLSRGIGGGEISRPQALAAGLAAAAERGGENTPEELAEAVGGGMDWR